MYHEGCGQEAHVACRTGLAPYTKKLENKESDLEDLTVSHTIIMRAFTAPQKIKLAIYLEAII